MYVYYIYICINIMYVYICMYCFHMYVMYDSYMYHVLLHTVSNLDSHNILVPTKVLMQPLSSYYLLQVLFFLFPPDDGDFLLTLTLTHTYLCSPYSHANA
jgi:hypothetical protein